MATLEDLPVISDIADTDIMYLRNPSTNVDYQITGAAVKSAITGGSAFVDVSADKTINEATGTTFYTTTLTNLVVFTLPSPVSFKNFEYTITKVDSGAGVIKILPNASEKIAGIDLVFLFEQYDAIKLKSNGSDWLISNDFKPYFKSGWINRSDWTNVHLGFTQIAYDNLSGTFTVGEIITESTTSNTWVIIDDTASVLTCVNATGTGVATNNETLTGGTSGATADVNGNTKDVNSNILHGWNSVLENIFFDVYYNLDTTVSEANKALGFFAVNESTTRIVGYSVLATDTDEAIIQTATDGFKIVDNSGDAALLDGEDYFYNLYVRLK